MKSFLAIATLIATGLANPLPPPPGAQVFNLVTKSYVLFPLLPPQFLLPAPDMFHFPFPFWQELTTTSQ
jgi:hypothetical protein